MIISMHSNSVFDTKSRGILEQQNASIKSVKKSSHGVTDQSLITPIINVTKGATREDSTALGENSQGSITSSSLEVSRLKEDLLNTDEEEPAITDHHVRTQS